MSQPIYHVDFEQGTDAWHSFRAGKWSASKAAIIMGGLDTGGLASYIKDLAWERVYGPMPGGFKSEAMERGNLVEPEARDWYAQHAGVEVEQVGIVQHATLPSVVWSPDGLFANRRRAIEAKCPLHKAWMEVKRTGKIPSEYRWQTRFGMWVGQLEAQDFVAYHPQAGGLVVPAEVTEKDKERLHDRIFSLEIKVAEWIEIIGNGGIRYQPPTIARSLADDLADAEAAY